MKESVAVAKETDAKKEFSPTRSDKNIQGLRNKPERQIGSLMSVICNIRRDGGTPSVESIATHLSSMHRAQRAPALLALQQTHGNRYVQRVVSGIQAKLVVEQPGDKYEQEADRVADAVMQISASQVNRRPKEEKEEELIQAKETHDNGPAVTPELEFRIHALSGGGQPLPESVRSFFEPRFGYDFSQVRVHTDRKSSRMAQALNARAFTLGNHIIFNQGEYAPSRADNQQLLAHELTHVIQQSEDSGRAQMIQLCTPAIEAELHPIPSSDEEAIRERRARLRELFNQIPPSNVDRCYGRLTERGRPERLAERFHDTLHTATRREMLNILRDKIVGMRVRSAALSLPSGVGFAVPEGDNGMRLNREYWFVEYVVTTSSGPSMLERFNNRQEPAVWPDVRDFVDRRSILGNYNLDVHITIRRDVDPAAAISDVWNPDSATNYAVDCYAAIQLVELRGIYFSYLRYSSVADFNLDYREFEIHLIGQQRGAGRGPIAHPHSTLLELDPGLEDLTDSTPIRMDATFPLQPGDWVTIDNSYYMEGVWESENAVYLGLRRFWGHPLGTFSPLSYAERISQRDDCRRNLRDGRYFPSDHNEMLQHLWVQQIGRPRAGSVTDWRSEH